MRGTQLPPIAFRSRAHSTSRRARARRERAVRFPWRLRASTLVAFAFADEDGRARAGESAGEGGTTRCGKDSECGAANEDEVDDIDDKLGRVRTVRGWGVAEGVGPGVVEVLIVRFGTWPPAPPVVVVMMRLDSRRGTTRAGGMTIGSRA